MPQPCPEPNQTALTLEDDPVSLERCLQIFDKFGDCTGLRANLDKTQAVWFGSGHGCGIEYLPHRKNKKIRRKRISWRTPLVMSKKSEQ
jgi:hypothetical protein